MLGFENKGLLVAFSFLVAGLIIGYFNFLGFAITSSCMTPDQIRQECSKIENSTPESCLGFYWKGCWTVHGQTNPDDRANYKMIRGETFSLREYDADKGKKVEVFKSNACKTDSDCSWIVDEGLDVGSDVVTPTIYDKVTCVDQSDLIKLTAGIETYTSKEYKRISPRIYEKVQLDSRFSSLTPYLNSEGSHLVTVQGVQIREYVLNGKPVVRQVPNGLIIMHNGKLYQFKEKRILNQVFQIGSCPNKGEVCERIESYELKYSLPNWFIGSDTHCWRDRQGRVAGCEEEKIPVTMYVYFPLTGRCKFMNPPEEVKVPEGCVKIG